MLDTLSYAKKLKASGVPEEQAEVHAQTLAETIEEGLVTKDDLRREMSELRTELKDTENRLIKWIVGVGIALAGLTIAL